jgi:hypothetical protein
LLPSGGVTISNVVRLLFGFYGSEMRKSRQRKKKKKKHTQPEWNGSQVWMLAASKLNKEYWITDKG